MVIVKHLRQTRLRRAIPLAAVWLAVGLPAAGVSGCGGAARPNVPFGKVTGQITLDGEPLAKARVVYEPQAGRPSYGLTSEAGEYELRYKGQPWGAIVGRHTVRITTAEVIEESPDADPVIIKERLPKRYHEASTLTADVTAGNNIIDFALTSK